MYDVRIEEGERVPSDDQSRHSLNREAEPDTLRRRAEEIFLQAAVLPSSERHACLDAHCGGDVELRAEVESLLAYDTDGDGWISGLVEGAAASVLVGDLLPGSHVGPYRVIREIGRGGMGTVSLAERDDQAFQKQVAIKLVKRGMDIETVVGRFRHERQILARLDHPYIAKLLDAGSVPDGRPYFVMEYVQGSRITDYCNRHNLSIDERCELFRKVCDAVAYAHRSLVIHRDLKPGNILVGEDGIPKLLDFGIAKVLSLGPEEQTHTCTAMAGRMGTPEYASPEQIKGEPVTTASDVYSLGVLWYEMLAGQRPYSLDKLTPAALEQAICQEEPERPSTVAGERRESQTGSGWGRLKAVFRRSQPGVGPELDNIVLMAMRKEPERRYRSADELSEDVRRYLDGRPVLARGDKLTYRAGKFLRRHRLGVLAASAAILSLIAGAAVAVWEAKVANAQRQRAERRLEEMVELANRSLFDIHATLEKLPGASEARRDIVKNTLEFLNRLDRDGDNDPAVREALATAYTRIAAVEGELGDSPGALASDRRAQQMLQNLLTAKPADPALGAQMLELELDTAERLSNVNNRTEAIKLLRETVARGEALTARDPNNRKTSALLVQAYRQLANQSGTLFPVQGAETARKAIQLNEKLVSQDPGNRSLLRQLALGYRALGMNLQLGGDVDSRNILSNAHNAYRKQLEILEGLAARYPNDAVVRNDLGNGYNAMGDFVGDPRRAGYYDPILASEYFHKVVVMTEAAAKADPKDMDARSDLSEALFRYGYSMTAPGQRAASLAVLRQAVAVAEETHRLDPANMTYSMAASYAQRRLGERLKQIGDFNGALGAYTRARELALQLVQAQPGHQMARGAVGEADKYIADLLAQAGDRRAIGYMLHAVTQVDAAIQLGGGVLPVRIYKPRCQRWLGDIYSVLAAKDGSLASRRDDWKNARDAYSRAASEYRTLLASTNVAKYKKEMADAERLVSESDKRLNGR
jgi:serine/threonine protein kinase